MEFFIMATFGLVALFLGSVALVEGVYAMGRLWSRWSFWWHSRRRSLRHATFASASMRRYALGKGPSPLGKLRFTKSRREELSSGTNEKD